MVTPTKPIRLLLVDDHPYVRAGMRTLLARFSNIQVIGEANSVASAVAETGRLKPDVVVMDIRLPDGTGLQACRQIQKLPHPSRVLILTAFTDDDLVYDAIAAGADGYLLKEIDVEGLVRALELVVTGQSVLDPAVTKRVMTLVRNPEDVQTHRGIEMLSPQERRIIALVADGKTNKEIAAEMGLSDKTVKNYFSNVLDKLQLTRRSQAAAFYAQHGQK